MQHPGWHIQPDSPAGFASRFAERPSGLLQAELGRKGNRFVEEAGRLAGRMCQEQRHKRDEGPDNDIARGRGTPIQGVVTKHQALEEVREFHGFAPLLFVVFLSTANVYQPRLFFQQRTAELSVF